MILEHEEPLKLKSRQYLEQHYQARKELATRHFNHYCSFMTEYDLANHIYYVNSKLEAVERGEIKRLMIFEPPGHAKSTYASVLFPSWYMGRNPKNSIISASYSQSLSERFGGRVRNIVGSKNYPFDGVGLNPGTKARGEWETNQEGEYFAGSVGAGITGRRSDLGIIDDPIKGREDADSKTIRDKAWEWYKADFYTRLKPDGSIIIILTRWHEDDLVGRILHWSDEREMTIIPERYDYSSGTYKSTYDGQIWHIVSLPAIAEENDQLGRKPGEALWPGYYTKEKLKETERAQGVRNWNSLYQQKPRPDEGSYFTNNMIRRYHYENLDLTAGRRYAASDYAVSEEQTADFTEHGVMQLNPGNDIYVIDWWSGQMSTPVWAQMQIDLMCKWEPIQWAAEKGQIEKSVGPFLKKMMREQNVYCHIKGYPSSVDKQQRAQSIRGWASAGKLFIPYCTWGDQLVAQMLAFPAGVHDDKIDVLSLFGRMLMIMLGPPPPPEEEVAKEKEDKYIFGVKSGSKKVALKDSLW